MFLSADAASYSKGGCQGGEYRNGELQDFLPKFFFHHCLVFLGLVIAFDFSLSDFTSTVSFGLHCFCIIQSVILRIAP